jgi:hypothetical protein
LRLQPLDICNQRAIASSLQEEYRELEDQVADMTLAEFARTFPVAHREMMRCVIPLISGILEIQKNSPEKWGAAFAVGATICNHRSMAEIASLLGCSRALISYRARELCEKFNLPPSEAMKSDEASEIAKQARKEHE